MSQSITSINFCVGDLPLERVVVESDLKMEVYSAGNVCQWLMFQGKKEGSSHPAKMLLARIWIECRSAPFTVGHPSRTGPHPHHQSGKGPFQWLRVALVVSASHLRWTSGFSVGSRFLISMAFQRPGRQHHLTNGAAELVVSPLTSRHFIRRRLVKCLKFKRPSLSSESHRGDLRRSRENSTSSGEFRIEWTWKMKTGFLCVRAGVHADRLSPDWFGWMERINRRSFIWLVV